MGSSRRLRRFPLANLSDDRSLIAHTPKSVVEIGTTAMTLMDFATAGIDLLSLSHRRPHSTATAQDYRGTLQRASPITMGLRLKIRRDIGGTWSVHGVSRCPVSNFPSLSASLDYACKECAAAPATIELFVDGLYAVYPSGARLAASDRARARKRCASVNSINASELRVRCAARSARSILMAHLCR
jgi:hypothetical protein